MDTEQTLRINGAHESLGAQSLPDRSMTQPSGTPKFEVRYEEGGDLPVFVDHLYAETIESGIYLTIGTLLPRRGEPTTPREASVQATLFLPVSAIEAVYQMTTDVRRHFGAVDDLHTKEAATHRYDKPRSDVPALANFFNCASAPDGVILSVGRQSTATPNLGVVYASYQMTIRTMLQLHWIVENLVMLIQRPDGIAGGTNKRQ